MKKIEIIAVIFLLIIIIMPQENLKEKVDRLELELKDIKENIGIVSYPVDNNSEKALEEAVDRFFPDKLFNIIWNKIFYYSSFFESIDRYHQDTNAGGSITLNRDGLQLENDVSDSAYASAVLEADDNVEDADILKFDKETRFRTKVKIDDVSEVDLNISGNLGTIDGIEFQISDGAITGISSRAGTSSSVSLGSVTDNTFVLLEYRYIPNDRVNFYVNGVLKGSLTNNLPRQSIGTDNVFYSYFAKNAVSAATRTAYIMFFDLIQKK